MNIFENTPKTLQNDVDFDYQIYHSNIKLKKMKWKDIEIRLNVSMIKAGMKEKPKDFNMNNKLNKKDVERAIQLYNYFSKSQNFIDEFESFEFYRDQVVFLSQNNPKESNFRILGAMLGGTDGIITCQLLRNKKENNGEIGTPYRPSLVTEPTEIKISEMINEYETSNEILTVNKIGDLIEELEGHRPRNDTIRKYLFRVFHLKTIKVNHDEKERVLIDPERLIKSYYVLHKMIENEDGGIRCSLTFDVDEVGVRECNKNKNERILVPETFEGTVNAGMNPEGKNSTIISCICADGSMIDPLLVIDRKGYIENVKKYFPNIHVTHNESGFITSSIFEYWIMEIFIPTVVKKRQQLGLRPDEEALLILDNAPAHNRNFINSAVLAGCYQAFSTVSRCTSICG